MTDYDLAEEGWVVHSKWLTIRARRREISWEDVDFYSEIMRLSVKYGFCYASEYTLARFLRPDLELCSKKSEADKTKVETGERWVRRRVRSLIEHNLLKREQGKRPDGTLGKLFYCLNFQGAKVEQSGGGQVDPPGGTGVSGKGGQVDPPNILQENIYISRSSNACAKEQNEDLPNQTPTLERSPNYNPRADRRNQNMVNYRDQFLQRFGARILNSRQWKQLCKSGAVEMDRHTEELHDFCEDIRVDIGMKMQSRKSGAQHLGFDFKTSLQCVFEEWAKTDIQVRRIQNAEHRRVAAERSTEAQELQGMGFRERDHHFMKKQSEEKYERYKQSQRAVDEARGRDGSKLHDELGSVQLTASGEHKFLA